MQIYAQRNRDILQQSLKFEGSMQRLAATMEVLQEVQHSGMRSSEHSWQQEVVKFARSLLNTEKAAMKVSLKS